MPGKFRYVCLFLTLSTLFQLSAQGLIIKPYYGYLRPRMSDVNAKISNDITELSNLLGEAIQSPGEIDGDPVIGVQFEYHANEDYFMNINVSYYQEIAEVHQNSVISLPQWRLDYEREVELYDVMLNIHYYLGYSSWRRFNKYIGIGAGWMIVNARSLTRSTSQDYLTDTSGEFSGNFFSGIFSAGGNYRLFKLVKLWAEGGLQFGNAGQLDGRVTTGGAVQSESVFSDSSFDFTGFYARAGLGFALPFLK